MYAAMPVVLKEAVLKAYEACGWNLEDSTNTYGMEYPTFKDILREVKWVITSSAYSDEVKGNYVGSLVTRIKSMTNGINGKIFTCDKTDYVKLFDKKTIVDLSRIGACETKSLLMGILIMSLSEYRMHQAKGSMNQELKHITVLEEAHNILKNPIYITGGNEENGNLVGKSVEMISNSLAEMRTYGEGFIIVDQSPGALDISAIKNTNTKIIMRLPEESDRRQVGKAVGLNEKQINELAKMKKGVGVVYQNDWLDAVLCKFVKANITEKSYYGYKKKEKKNNDYSELLKLLIHKRVNEDLNYNINNIMKEIQYFNLSTKTKILLKQTCEDIKKENEPILLKESAFSKLSNIIVEVLEIEDKLQTITECGTSCELIQDEIEKYINAKTDDLSKECQLAIAQCVLRKIVEEDANYIDLYAKWREYAFEKMMLV